MMTTLEITLSLQTLLGMLGLGGSLGLVVGIICRIIGRDRINLTYVERAAFHRRTTTNMALTFALTTLLVWFLLPYELSYQMPSGVALNVWKMRQTSWGWACGFAVAGGLATWLGSYGTFRFSGRRGFGKHAHFHA